MFMNVLNETMNMHCDSHVMFLYKTFHFVRVWFLTHINSRIDMKFNSRAS